MSTKNEKNSTTIRVFSQDEKDRIFKLYKEGKNLKDIAEDLNLDFTSSEHKINEKTGKETGIASYVTINGDKYGLKQLLFYLDETRAAIEYETSNYKKGGRSTSEKVNNAAISFVAKLEELTNTTFINDDTDVKTINLQTILDISLQIAKELDEKAAAAAAKKQEETRLYKEAVEGAKKLGCTPEEYIELKKSFAAKKATTK